MKIDITTKNISLDNPLEVFVNEKIGSLDHLIGNDMGQARVEIGMSTKHHRSGPIFYAEVNLRLGSKLLRAEAHHEDLRSAIVAVKDELQIQIKKFKEKRIDQSRWVKK